MRKFAAFVVSCLAFSAYAQDSYDTAVGISNLDNSKDVLARVSARFTVQDCYTLANFYAKKGDRKAEQFWLMTGCLAGNNFQCSLIAHEYERLPNPEIARDELIRIYGIACNRPKQDERDLIACQKLTKLKRSKSESQ